MPDDQQGNASGYVTVEIYDQIYHLSGQDAEHIRQLAARVDAKMRAVAAHGRTVDSLRVAVMAALNLADELAQTAGGDVRPGHARAASLRGMLDEVLEEELKTGSWRSQPGHQKLPHQALLAQDLQFFAKTHNIRNRNRPAKQVGG